MNLVLGFCEADVHGGFRRQPIDTQATALPDSRPYPDLSPPPRSQQNTAPTLQDDSRAMEKQSPCLACLIPHAAWPPWSLPQAKAGLPVHLPPWLRDTCFLLWSPPLTPAPEGLTSRVGQQWPQGHTPTPPKGPRLPSAIPSASPQGSVKVPDEIIPLESKGGTAKASISLSVQMHSAQQQGEGSPKTPSFTEGTLGLEMARRRSRGSLEGPELKRQGL